MGHPPKRTHRGRVRGSVRRQLHVGDTVVVLGDDVSPAHARVLPVDDPEVELELIDQPRLPSLIAVMPRPRSGPQAAAADAAVLDAYALLVDEPLDAFWSWVEDTRWQPATKPPYEYEKWLMRRQYGPAGSWDGSDAEGALVLSSTFLSLAGQYLEGVRELLVSRHVIVPLAPLVRASFEACCRIAWLLEPLPEIPGRRVAKVPVRIWAARVRAVQVEDFTRAKTVTVSLNHNSAPKWGAAVRELRRVTLPGKFYPSETGELRDGELVYCGQRLPGFRAGALAYEKTFGVNWTAGGAYDWLSNASHPTPSALRELTKVTATGARRFEIEDASYPARLARLALVSFLHCWDQIAEYLDLRHDEVQPLLDRVGAQAT